MALHSLVAHSQTASDADKNRAAELLGRTIGAYTDKQQTSHEFVIQAPSKPEERRLWLQEQLDLLDRQKRAGTAIAGEIDAQSD